MAKHYPVQRHIRLAEGASPQSNNATMLVRVDRELSRVNKRLYRQSRVPSCKISLDANVAAGQGIDVYVLRDTWMNMKAYQMAKKVFDENSKQEMSMLAKGNKARWNDFRVNMGLSSFAELDAVIEGETTSTKMFGVGEYELSEVADAAGTAQTFRWLGSGANTFNIVDEYDRTGDTAQQPTFAQTGVAYDGLEDELDDSQVEHLSGDGNLPPYDGRVMENDVLVRVARLVNDGTGTSKLSTGFFNAPAGFIVLEGVGGGTSVTLDSAITLEVQAGDYKGVKAPSYLE
jgi:hypothetical protein